MAISPSARLASAALALILAGWSAYSAAQQDRPESILPPGFGEPAQPRPSPRPSAVQSAPAPAIAPGGAVVQPLPTASITPTPTATPSALPTIDAATLAQYEMPATARRSLALVGPAGPREGALAADAFAGGDGPFLERLMRGLSAPLPSRWMSILLRRALAAQVETPRGVNGADFAAERAWLLLRMGESDAARSVVQGVDTANYTPKLYQVAMNAMLANGDPAGLCPLVEGGRAATGERGWLLAQAMCAALSGTPRTAAPLIAAARRRHVASGIDLQLAQKVVGAGANGGQAVTIEWDPVSQLTVWRFGLALATEVDTPANLLATVGRQVTYWRALAPQIPISARVAAADAAAGQGVLSNAALVDFYGAIHADDDASAADDAVATQLIDAYRGTDAAARLAAMRQLWGDTDKRVPYARLVLTARAAARVPVAGGVKGGDQLIASMLSAGLDRTAARWRGAVDVGSDGWAMLALADPDRRAPLSYRDLSGYAGTGDAALKQRLFFAGLVGLGRLAGDDIERAARALDVRIGAENSWTLALDRAVRGHQPGTVALLAAAGMQTPSWRGVPPATLYRIVAALRAVGLGAEARMIAAEAIARA